MGILTRLLLQPSALRALRQARELLRDATPLRKDCGGVCGAACCQPDESGENGMLLYPYEEWFYRKPIAGFAFHLADDDTLYKGGKRLVCEGACPRDERPLACRLFPLRLRVLCDERGTRTRAELDARAWQVCPLCEDGVRGLNAAFVAACEQAGDAMAGHVSLLEALYREQELMEEMKNALG